MATSRNTVGSSSQMPSNARQPKVYQIDFTAVASGKRIASTKRRVRWRFGFANPEALAAGETGTACRGEEHDVTLVWSITSGKRLILADGQEVHYSNSRSGAFDFSWTMRGNHVLKVVAHASPPLSPTPGFRQYDFFVDGQSFFTFPKVYRLGLAQNDPRAHGHSHSHHSNAIALADRGPRTANYTSKRSDSSNIASLEAPHNLDEEEAYLQEAIKNSLEEQQKSPPAPSSGASIGAGAVGPHVDDPDLLLDFLAEDAVPVPAPAPLALPASSPWDAGGFAAHPAQQPVAALPPSTSNGYAANNELVPAFGAPAPATSWGGVPQPPAQPYGQNAPVPPAVQVDNTMVSPHPQATPSTLGLNSPAPDPTFFQSPQQPPQPPPQPPRSAPLGGDQGFAGAPAPPQAQGFAVPSSGGFPQAQPSGVNVDPFAAPQPAAPQPPASQPPAGFPSAVNGSVPNAVYTPNLAQDANSTGFAPAPGQDAPNATANAPPSGMPTLTMNKLSGDLGDIFDNSTDNNAAAPSGSLADQAYAKLANLDQFDLVSKKQETRHNPFDTVSTSIGVQPSLADMKSQNSKATPAKEIMKSAQTSALVVSNQQQGNWGGVAGQYGAPQMDQQNQFSGQQQFGQPPSTQQPQYGQQPPAQQPQFGQQPPMQQSPFGQQPPMQQQPMQQQPMQQPQMQQPQFGQQAPMQQPQYQQYGQAPQFGAQQGQY